MNWISQIGGRCNDNICALCGDKFSKTPDRLIIHLSPFQQETRLQGPIKRSRDDDQELLEIYVDTNPNSRSRRREHCFHLNCLCEMIVHNLESGVNPINPLNRELFTDDQINDITVLCQGDPETRNEMNEIREKYRLGRERTRRFRQLLKDDFNTNKNIIRTLNEKLDKLRTRVNNYGFDELAHIIFNRTLYLLDDVTYNVTKTVAELSDPPFTMDLDLRDLYMGAFLTIRKDIRKISNHIIRNRFALMDRLWTYENQDSLSSSNDVPSQYSDIKTDSDSSVEEIDYPDSESD